MTVARAALQSQWNSTTKDGDLFFLLWMLFLDQMMM
jgi:hypothetical protein